ncbi:glycosyltransferase family 2 protein [Flavobacteriaceae bacterium XHP0103]|uniref:glycosyltransferase family 2 protein n=1 Tax=Marixanthotalea marina TaxID=2844359 RepID=UPI002989DC97|nr:glycosyltransferase family 2 protein [Marixanthotalea marina]MBU3822288.1 glycosyltransferase family 2 protein [Marixanthotalea marina]
MNPLVSVIIPVYNAEKFLEKCIDSLLSQSFKDYEVLLINDGSSDHSGSVCHKYSNIDNRIRVFHQKNKGASAARNLGMEKAKGEWICFVDSDDWVKENYLNNLVVSIEPGIDLVIGGFTQTDNNITKEVVLTETDINIDSLETELILNELALFNYSFPFGKLFKKKIIDTYSVQFITKAIMFEDTIFLMQYLKHSKSLKIINAIDYQYVLNEGSLSFKLHSFEAEYTIAEKLLDISIDDFSLTIKNLKNKYSKLGKRISNSTNRAILSLLRNQSNTKMEVVEKLKSIDKRCLELYSHFYTPYGFFRKMIKFLVIKKCYSFCYYYSKTAYKISHLVTSQ